MTDNQKRQGFDLTDAATLGLLAVQAAAAFYIYDFGPTGPIAVHFDLHGRANGWGDRNGLATGIAVLAGATLLINLMLRLKLFTGGMGDSRRINAVARGLIVAVGVLVTGLLTSLAFAHGAGFGQQRLPLTFTWLMFVIIGAFVGKAAPNAFVGVHVYWTLRSRLAWDKANRLLGRIFFFGGLIGVLAMPFVDLGHDFALVMGWLLIVAGGGGAVAIIESWRVWRTDPERIP